MKKWIFFPLISVTFYTLSLSVACNQSKQTLPTPQNRLLSQTVEPSFGEDFDFPPLPTPPSSDVFDLSDVDISAIDSTRKLIAFTFDDSPASTLENILAVFASYNENNPDCPATATLFCNGYLMGEDTFPALSTALTLGWELGNHTYSHPDVTTISLEEYAEQLSKTETLLNKIDKKQTHLFRPPYGRINDALKQLTNAPVIHWTIDTLDWQNTPADVIYNTVFDEKFSGAIVLMHDGYTDTVTALKRLLPDLKEAGYQVVSVSQMAKAHGCTLKNGGHYIRARKQGNG